jgi:hypothetical protein
MPRQFRNLLKEATIDYRTVGTDEILGDYSFTVVKICYKKKAMHINEIFTA